MALFFGAKPFSSFDEVGFLIVTLLPRKRRETQLWLIIHEVRFCQERLHHMLRGSLDRHGFQLSG